MHPGVVQDRGKALSTQSFKERNALQHSQASATKDCLPGIFQCSPRMADWARRAESLLVSCPESSFYRNVAPVTAIGVPPAAALVWL